MDGSLQGQIVLLILSVSLWSCRYGDNLHSEPYFLSQEDKVLIQEGDIILRMGEGWLSQFICKHLHDTIRVSHCGILVKSEADWEVIHVLSKEVSDIDGVQSCPLGQFNQDCPFKARLGKGIGRKSPVLPEPENPLRPSV